MEINELPWSTRSFSGNQQLTNASQTSSKVYPLSTEALLKCVWQSTTWSITFPSNHIRSIATSSLNTILSGGAVTLKCWAGRENMLQVSHSLDISSRSFRVLSYTSLTLVRFSRLISLSVDGCLNFGCSFLSSALVRNMLALGHYRYMWPNFRTSGIE